jgi:DNA polymerase-3 subunit delta'
MISEHLDKNNLHHAYLIEGVSDVVSLEIIEFLKSLGIDTIGNPDFVHIQLDSFKIEDARNLKSYANQKSFSSGKKVFIVSANSFLLEAQNSLLKMFEEPIRDTHFFLIVPDTNALLRTLVSRFYLISSQSMLEEKENRKEAEKFISMPFLDRIGFIKELIAAPDEEDEEGNEIVVLNSSRAKALKFLNELESILHSKILSRGTLDKIEIDFFDHIFKVRELLRIPGSSTKSLMESVALIIPIF